LKFVGDLNPESVLTDLASRKEYVPRHSRIGIWVEQSRLEQEQFRRQHEAAVKNSKPGESELGAKKHSTVQRYAKVERCRRTLTGHQRSFLQSVGALRVLPKATSDVLVTTYVACIDPLLPIIDCKKLLQDYTTGNASPFLIQAICLVACKTEEAISYLRLYEDGQLMEQIPFARALHTGLDAAMKADLEADRFTKIQIMTLMSLHNDGPGGIEESSLHLAMAIHDAQTTGLHINTPGRTPNDQAGLLWWTLWTLDKFNACLGGRPLVIVDRDIDIDRPTLESNVRSQSMGVWLSMGDLLDKVIEFYRPRADPDAAGWESDFPTFTETTSHCSIDMLEPSHRNILEVCYNIIGILACRAGGPKTLSYNRRKASADRIQKLTTEGAQAHLPPLPLVPYAVSLSLTVAYRGLRDSHSDPIQTQLDLAARCDILESISKTWWTADAMAKLGRKALKSLQHPSISEESRIVGDALEVETAPCKYGPFDGNKSGSATANTTDRLVRTSSDESSSGLQVLSQAAATLGRPQRDTLNIPNITTNGANNIDPRNSHMTSHPNKRLRFDDEESPSMSQLPFASTASHTHPTHTHLTSSLHSPPSISHASNPTSTLTNTPAQTPLSTNPQTSNLNMLHHKPHPHSTSGVFEINPSLDPFCATLPMTDVNGGPIITTTAADADADADAAAATLEISPDSYAFSDLDNLFDGFYTLRYPTMFEDPLFDGGAYDQMQFAWPPDMDMNMDIGLGSTGIMNLSTMNGGGIGDDMAQ